MGKRIIIIEDICYIRDSFHELLQANQDYDVVNTYSNSEDAIANLVADQPDIILLDIELPGMSGLRAIPIIKEKFPDCIILIITVFDDSDKVFQALCAGASGYLLKSANFRAINEAIEELLAGGAPMSLPIARLVVQSFQRHGKSPLSERESQVLERISKGKSYSKIAQELFIGKETVRTHIRNIYKKLEVTSKEDALRIAYKNRWINPHL